MINDGYVIYRVRRQVNADHLRRAAHWRLLREAGLVPGKQIKRATCRPLCQLGRALIALGEQLQQYGQPRLATH